MTREEAIKTLYLMKFHAGRIGKEALDMAIDALRQQGNEQKYEKAVRMLGEFGKLFMEYRGDPRGQVGRSCEPIEKEVFSMPEMIDVDGGKWVPVNADALRDLVGRYLQLKKQSENQEQADVVQVTRCGGCKYGRKCGDEISCYHPEYALREGVWSYEEDFYCKYGEPKGKQMNHDATHCSDYQKGICPLSCYRAKLTEDLKWIHYDLPTSWSNFKGTNECLVWPKREEKDERETRASEKTPPAAGIH